VIETKYNLNHAQEILEPCGVLGNYLRLKKSGVWPAIKRDLLLLAETEGLRWRPARALKHLPGAPEVKTTPMLPNPFTGRELAAFMLEGAGALVADFYGGWSDGPDQDRLDDLDADSKASRAVTEAFDAYRHAIAQVGKWDEAALARRDAAHKAYWKSNNDRELLQVLDHAEAEWKVAYQAWLTAMVCRLLEHQPQPHAATEAPVPAPARAPRRTAWEVASPYMVQVLKNGQFSTGKQLYRALESKAGPDSPFDAGTGSHRGSLFVRDVASPLALKTVQNRFDALRKLAQTSTP
jgi:hypothetical protein